MLPEELNLDIHANLSTSNASGCNMFWPKKGERERDGMRGMVQEKMEKLLKACSLLPVVRRRFLLPTAGTLPRTSCIELKSWQEQEVGRQRREDAVCVSERFRMSKQEVKPKFLELCSGKKDSIIDLRGC